MLNKILCLLVLIYIKNDLCLSSDVPPEVDTPLGKIRGIWTTSNSGRKYAAYQGVPYGKPPIGELRFEEPEPVEPWDEVLEATRTYVCLQASFHGKIQGDEDCLYLNVYVPAREIDSESTFDVLVHIHGGAFLGGSGHRLVDSKLLLDKDLIVVSINYRLGVLGFLSTEDEAIPGNNGMKDQVLALKWIKENIASFGGKPDSVTLTGLSTGGASVHLHYFSPLSKGLFARGVSQSGTALCPWAIKENPLEIAQKLAANLNCSVTPTSELKKCLKGRPANLLLENLKDFTYDFKSLSVPFAPVIEKDSTNPFLTEDPYLLLKNKKVLDVPWITSTTTDEGLLSTTPHYATLEKFDSDWPEIAHYYLDYNYTLPASKREEVAKKIKDFYLGPEEHIDKENFKKFTQIFTDRLFVIGAETAAKLQARVNKSPVYYFVFNYKEGQNKLVQIYSGGADVEGVGHGEDLVYFYASLKPVKSKSDTDLRSACQNMLYSYATTGKPSFEGADEWLPTTDSELVYLNISGPENIKLQRTKHLAPIEFWSNLGLQEKEDLRIKDEL